MQAITCTAGTAEQGSPKQGLARRGRRQHSSAVAEERCTPAQAGCDTVVLLWMQQTDSLHSTGEADHAAEPGNTADTAPQQTASQRGEKLRRLPCSRSRSRSCCNQSIIRAGTAGKTAARAQGPSTGPPQPPKAGKRQTGSMCTSAQVLFIARCVYIRSDLVADAGVPTGSLTRGAQTRSKGLVSYESAGAYGAAQAAASLTSGIGSCLGSAMDMCHRQHLLLLQQG